MSWRLAESLKTLRTQINTEFPNRSKVSDGAVGDLRHKKSKSDHNPNSAGVVRAIDVTHDPASGMDCNKLATALVDSGDNRIKYLIWNRKIWNPSISKSWRTYKGSNGHTKHLHISVQSTAKRYDDKSDWSLNFNSSPTVHPDPELIEVGDKGFAVSKLQTDLAQLDYLKAEDIDGDFGTITKDAVEKFQIDNYLESDGIVGKETKKLLDKKLAEPKPITIEIVEDDEQDSALPSAKDEPTESATTPATTPPDTDQTEELAEPTESNEPTDQPAYIPQMDTFKNWLKWLGGGGGLSLAGSYFGGLSETIQIILGILIIVLVVGGLVAFIFYHKQVFEYVGKMNLAGKKIKGSPPKE